MDVTASKKKHQKETCVLQAKTLLVPKVGNMTEGLLYMAATIGCFALARPSGAFREPFT
jgi:hypothetical protein